MLIRCLQTEFILKARITQLSYSEDYQLKLLDQFSSKQVIGLCYHLKFVWYY